MLYRFNHNRQATVEEPDKGCLPSKMVRKTNKNPKPDRSTPGSTRTALDSEVPGCLATSGLQGSGQPAEQPGPAPATLLEANQHQPEVPNNENPIQARQKFSTSINKDIMTCYYKSSPNRRGYLKRMYNNWKELHPESDLTEQRLADQRRYITRTNVFTQLQLNEIQSSIQAAEIQEIQEIQNISVPEVVVAVEEEITHVDLPNNYQVQASPLPSLQSDNRQLTEDQEKLKERIMNQMKTCEERIRLPSIKFMPKKLLADINAAIENIESRTLQETNQLMYSAALIATEDLMPERMKKKGRMPAVPKWKIRLQNKIGTLRSDASKLKEMKEKKLNNNKTKGYLIKKYHLDKRKIKEALEIVKQQIMAVSKKIQRYEDKIKQFQQNRLFQCNQKRFYQSISTKTTDQTTDSRVKPSSNEMLRFWRDIWDNPKNYNKQAGWLEIVKLTTDAASLNEMNITSQMVKARTKKIKNWTAPGEDELHGFWLKHLTSTHSRLAEQFDRTIKQGRIDQWLTTGRTYLIMKDPSKGPIPSNYRPITCLPTMFKLLTGIIADTIQSHLIQNNLYPFEQKGNCKNSRGTKDQLLIDKMVIENCKRRRNNLHVAWIDYKKAFDSLPHDWILKSLELVGINGNIQEFIKAAMEKWNTKLTIDGEQIGRVNIRRGIFQGDSLSPLLFVIALIPLTKILNKTNMGYQISKTSSRINHLLYMDDLKLYGKSRQEIESILNTVRIFSNDITMEFGLDKCATLSITRGKIVKTEGIDMPKNFIKPLDEEESYKYLGVLQADNIKHKEVKNKISREYIRRVRKILKSKLNGKNTIQAINTWAIPVVRYTAGVINWTQAELEVLDRKTRKAMTINHALHPQSDVSRLYLPRKIGGRGLLQVHQTVEEEKRGIFYYLQHSENSVLKSIVTEGTIKEYQETKQEFKSQQMQSRIENWHSKALHGQFIRDTNDKINQEQTWLWLRKATLKKETEGLIMAAQDQALRTNAIKAKIDKSSKDSKCRLCKEKDETIDHIISCCPKIAQTDYLVRHNKVAAMLHWNICKNYNLPSSKNWWEHQPEKVTENEVIKLLWDFRIQCDRHLVHNTPDITIVYKQENKVQIVDVAIPGDARVSVKEFEKITKYRDLEIEIERLWNKKARTTPIIIGALGAIPKDLDQHLKTLGIDKINIGQLQMATLLGTAYILRRYLQSS